MSIAGGVVLVALLIPAAVVVAVGLVVVVAATVSGGRRETDPAGLRTTAVFLAVTNWVAIFLALFATLAIVASVVSYVHGSAGNTLQALMSSQAPLGPGSVRMAVGSSSDGIMRVAESGPNVTSTALAAGLVALAAGVVLFLYGRRLWSLIKDPAVVEGPAGPPVRVYVMATCFTAVFIAVGAGASALFGVYRAVAPGVAGMGSAHSPGVRQLLDSAYLGVAAGAIWWFHHRVAFPAPSDPPGVGGPETGSSL